MSANTTSGLEAVQDLECDQEVPINMERTIGHIPDDYDNLINGVIREVIQNSVDGRVQNISRNGSSIEEVDGLEITFKIVKNSDGPDMLEIIDNAGGMPKKILKNNLIGVDTPSPDKQTGDMNGAYGRGFYVIDGAGDGESYIQTRHVGYTYSVRVDGKGGATSVATDSSSIFPQQEDGTYIVCEGVYDSVVRKLGDFSYFKDRVLESFWNLFDKFDVTVSHTVVEDNGATTENSITESPLKLSDYEDDIIRHRDDFPEITVDGDKGCLTELTLYHTRNMSEEELEYINGICAMKGTVETGPIMKVMSYSPQAPSISDGNMIGVADISGMCPQFEKNDHFDLDPGAKDRCGWKTEAQKAHKENFNDGMKTEEEQQIESDLRANVNETLSVFDEDIGDLFTGSTEASGSNGSKSKSAEETDSDSTKTLQIKSRVGGSGKEFDVGEEVPFTVDISIPESSNCYEWRIKTSVSGPLSGSLGKSVVIDPGYTETVTMFNEVIPEEGEYTFTAELYNENNVAIFADSDESDPVSTSSYTFYAGDVERDQSVSVSSSNSGTPELLKDIMLTENSDGDWRVSVEADREGFSASINTGRVELQQVTSGGASSRELEQLAQTATGWVLDELSAQIAKRTVDSNDFEEVHKKQREIADELTSLYHKNN